MTTTSTGISLSALLRALLLAMLIALVVPALAMADDAPTGVLDPPALTTEPDGPAVVTPPYADPVPVDQTTPADTTPVDQTNGETPTVDPTPTAPPAASTPDPVAETPPVESEVIPAPAPVAPPEVTVTTPELVATPAVPPDDATARLLPVVVIPPANADAVPGRVADSGPSAPTGITSAAVATSITLAAGTDTPVAPFAGTTPGNDPAAPSAATLSGLLTQNAALHQDLFTLDPGQRHSPVGPVAATRMERGPGIGLGDEVVSTLFGESVVAPIGTITSGSSLLAVLAGYVLPGVGGPPATTLIMFVLVGLLVAIARAPRPQLSERLWSGSLMGAASGHGLAVCRPG